MLRGNRQKVIPSKPGGNGYIFPMQTPVKGIGGHGVPFPKRRKSGFSPMRFLKHLGKSIRNAYGLVLSNGTYPSKEQSSVGMRTPDQLEAHSREALNDCIDYVNYSSKSHGSNHCGGRFSI